MNLFIAHVNLEDHKKEVEMLFNKLHNNYDKRGKVSILTPDYMIHTNMKHCDGCQSPNNKKIKQAKEEFAIFVSNTYCD